MGKKLLNAPVYFTVVQVQFNPILELDSHIPAIQSKMRQAQFPDFKKEVLQRLDFPIHQGQMIAPTLTSQARYLFGDIAGRTTFLLEANALTLQTTSYDTFETFSAMFLTGLETVHSALNLDFVERIGLRYLNAVQPLKEGDTLRDFLVPEVLGLAFRGQGQLEVSLSQTHTTTDAGQLIARVVIRSGPIALPPELNGIPMLLDARFTQREGLHAIVDTDAFIAKREIFDLHGIEARLTALHDQTDVSFKGMVTEHALASWV
jgi:uncharacterized protein (TIGR04255 family)